MKSVRFLFLVEDDFEDLELFYPLYRLREEGYVAVVASSSQREIVGKKGYSIRADVRYADVDTDKFDALVIPGGKSPERVRVHGDAVKIVRSFVEKEKVIAAICHGPQVLISAGVVKGKRMTSWIGIRDDLIAAGAIYDDAEVVVDRGIITSRKPDDLPAFCRELLRVVKSVESSRK